MIKANQQSWVQILQERHPANIAPMW